MADAWLLPSGDVLLSPEGAMLLALALEVAFRAGRPNGKHPPARLRALARVLAEAGVTGPQKDADGASQRAGSNQAARPAASICSAAGGPLSTTQVAAVTGLTSHAVRVAIGRGRLAATRDEGGRWLVSREAVEIWRGHSGAAC
jgi:excisionase family DNA binding protein